MLHYRAHALGSKEVDNALTTQVSCKSGNIHVAPRLTRTSVATFWYTSLRAGGTNALKPVNALAGAPASITASKKLVTRSGKLTFFSRKSLSICTQTLNLAGCLAMSWDSLPIYATAAPLVCACDAWPGSVGAPPPVLVVLDTRGGGADGDGAGDGCEAPAVTAEGGAGAEGTGAADDPVSGTVLSDCPIGGAEAVVAGLSPSAGPRARCAPAEAAAADVVVSSDIACGAACAGTSAGMPVKPPFAPALDPAGTIARDTCEADADVGTPLPRPADWRLDGTAKSACVAASAAADRLCPATDDAAPPPAPPDGAALGNDAICRGTAAKEIAACAGTTWSDLPAVSCLCKLANTARQCPAMRASSLEVMGGQQSVHRNQGLRFAVPNDGAIPGTPSLLMAALKHVRHVACPHLGLVHTTHICCLTQVMHHNDFFDCDAGLGRGAGAGTMSAARACLVDMRADERRREPEGSTKASSEPVEWVSLPPPSTAV